VAEEARSAARAVHGAAAARPDQRAALAVLTAEAADQAAVQLATETEHAADIVARDALQAAAAVQAAALNIMYEIAIDAACQHLLVPISRADHPRAQSKGRIS
jgi:hypothetical protein